MISQVVGYGPHVIHDVVQHIGVAAILGVLAQLGEHVACIWHLYAVVCMDLVKPLCARGQDARGTDAFAADLAALLYDDNAEPGLNCAHCRDGS